MATTTTRADTAVTPPRRNQSAARRRALRALTGMAGLVLAGGLLAYSALQLQTEIQAIAAERALSRSDWIRARSRAESAIRGRPGEFRYLELSSRAEEGAGNHVRADGWRAAALWQRPGSPYAWAAFVRPFLGKPDDARLARLLDRIDHLGAQERNLWRLQAVLGLHFLGKISDSHAQDLLKKNILREYQRRRYSLVSQSILQQHEQVLCDVLQSSSPQEKWCEDIRKVRARCGAAWQSTDRWCGEMKTFWTRAAYPDLQ